MGRALFPPERESPELLNSGGLSTSASGLVFFSVTRVGDDSRTVGNGVPPSASSHRIFPSSDKDTIMQAVRLLYITALYSMKTSNQFPTETLVFSIHKYCFLTAFSVQHCKGVVSDVCFRPDGFLMPCCVGGVLGGLLSTSVRTGPWL